jgi:hypothetical protein
VVAPEVEEEKERSRSNKQMIQQKVGHQCVFWMMMSGEFV